VAGGVAGVAGQQGARCSPAWTAKLASAEREWHERERALAARASAVRATNAQRGRRRAARAERTPVDVVQTAGTPPKRRQDGLADHELELEQQERAQPRSRARRGSSARFPAAPAQLPTSFCWCGVGGGATASARDWSGDVGAAACLLRRMALRALRHQAESVVGSPGRAIVTGIERRDQLAGVWRDAWRDPSPGTTSQLLELLGVADEARKTTEPTARSARVARKFRPRSQ
jgi:hypothetical protein